MCRQQLRLICRSLPIHPPSRETDPSCTRTQCPLWFVLQVVGPQDQVRFRISSVSVGGTCNIFREYMLFSRSQSSASLYLTREKKDHGDFLMLDTHCHLNKFGLKQLINVMWWWWNVQSKDRAVNMGWADFVCQPKRSNMWESQTPRHIHVTFTTNLNRYTEIHHYLLKPVTLLHPTGITGFKWYLFYCYTFNHANTTEICFHSFKFYIIQCIQDLQYPYSTFIICNFIVSFLRWLWL